MCLREKEADPAEPERRGPGPKQRRPHSDRLVVAAVGDQRLELEEPSLEVVGAAYRLGEEELDGLVGPPRDVFERRQRRTRAACLDQVDRGRGDVTLA